ncbi:MAG: cohesin domain-containing protein [bacterium]|nr:cohesin domain-containing protein [bacterium]
MRSFTLKALFTLTILLVLVSPKSVFADTIFLSPLTGTYSVGDTFSVRIMVSSPQQSINAVSGVLSFPADSLQVTSISKIGSVLSLWIQEPSFSNSRGTVTFEGVVPNPGFSESNGRVLGVNFKVVGTGNALIRLTSGSLLANDGYGTNILKTLGTASFALEQKQQLPVTPPAVLETNGTDGEDNLAPAIDLGTLDKEEEADTLPFGTPSLKTAISWLLALFFLLALIVALIFLLTHTAAKGAGNVSRLRKDMRKDLHNIDRLTGKSFELLKEDVGDSLHILERTRDKRKLTAEEETITHRLKQNLADAEKIIHQEVVHAEKDLGD